VTGIVGSTDARAFSWCAIKYLKVEIEPPTSASLTVKSALLSRSQRAHYRLSWAERLARNARPENCGRVMIHLFGVPEGFVTSLGRVPA
jgi:hypothetical protein